MAADKIARVVGGASLALTEDPVPTTPPQQSLPFWQQPAFVVTVLLMIPIYFVTGVVLFPWEVYTKAGTAIYSPEMRSAVITAALLATITAIVGFWLAGSHGAKPNPDVDKPPNAPPPTTGDTTK